MYFVSKIVLTFCKGIFFLVIDNFVVEGQEFAKFLRSLLRTSYSNSKRSEQFWKQNAFNLFLEVYQI